MARRPGQGGRGAFRRAVALVLRTVWRSKNAAAARARRAWIDDEPPRPSLLRQARARVGGAVYAALRPGRNALAVLHRGLASLHRALASFTLKRARAFVRRRLMLLRRRFRGPGAGKTPPPPPPPPKKNGIAKLYGGDRRRRRPAASSSSSSESEEEPQTYTVDGEEVPQAIVSRYVEYCTKACRPSSIVCHFCVHECQRTRDFTVHTSDVIRHSSMLHRDPELPAVPCEEPGCKVRTRPGRDQALHVYFCHQLPHGWWV